MEILQQPVVIMSGLAVAVVIILFATFARMLRKVGPNQALIRYGLGGTRIVHGGAQMVLPLIHSAQELSLELMSFDVAPQQDLYTNQGVAVTVEAVAQLKIKNDPESIRTAAEQFLTKTPPQRESLIRLVMEGHLRGIIGQLTVEQIVKQPEMVADRMRANVAEDVAKMGLEVVSFTIKEVRDKNQYIENMGRPDIARIKSGADIAAAEAERDTAMKQAGYMREAAVARAEADQQRVLAETLSQAKQAEAQKELAVKRASYEAEAKKQQAQADKAYEIQANIMQQQVVTEAVNVDRVRKEGEIKVQEAEIQRKERELAATILKQAEAEKKRIETLAEAEKLRLGLEAAGRAEAQRTEGAAAAEVIRLKGTAEAEIIRSKGQSEAAAMQLKASAYLEYNEAAVLDKLIAGLPDVVRALAEPLGKVDKITVVSTGGDGGAGVNRITADMATMVAQVPALIESLTGKKISDLMRQVRPLAPGEVAAPADTPVKAPPSGIPGTPASPTAKKS
ncbi:MAG TPA: SPFH domain-containing protein [Gemmatimonadaceae bacterium]|nr:SPFH domain-containing protein [Gemmatimonadaceae bacterium]